MRPVAPALDAIEIAYSEAAASVPGLAAAVAGALAEAARHGPVERAVVHVHDLAGIRPRTPRTLEGVVVASGGSGDAQSTTVVRVSLDGEVRGVRSFADGGGDQAAEEPVDAAALAETLPGGVRPEGPWRHRPLGFVEIHETPPPPNPERSGATVIADARTGRLLYAASSGLGARYLGP